MLNLRFSRLPHFVQDLRDMHQKSSLPSIRKSGRAIDKKVGTIRCKIKKLIFVVQQAR